MASLNDSRLEMMLPQECIAPVSAATSYLVGLLILFWVVVVIIVLSLISPYSCFTLFRPRGHCLERAASKQWGKATPQPERGSASRGLLRQQSTIEDMCSYAAGKTQGDTRPSLCEPLLVDSDQHHGGELELEETLANEGQPGEGSGEANANRGVSRG